MGAIDNEGSVRVSPHLGFESPDSILQGETMIDQSKITRVEVIDHRKGANPPGRVFTVWESEDRAQISFSVQDKEQTLKIFVDDTVDRCQFCNGTKGGVRGNENKYGSVIVCDYCSVVVDELLKSYLAK